MITRGIINRISDGPGGIEQVASGGTGASTAPEASSNLKFSYIAGQTGTLVSTTSATEIVAFTVTLPAMGANDAIRVTALGSCTNSAANKIVRIRLGGLAGTTHANPTISTSLSWGVTQIIQNAGSASSQWSRGMSSSTFSPYAASGNAGQTSSVDTSTGTAQLVVTLQSDGVDTIALRSATVEIIRGNP